MYAYGFVVSQVVNFSCFSFLLITFVYRWAPLFDLVYEVLLTFLHFAQSEMFYPIFYSICFNSKLLRWSSWVEKVIPLQF